MTSHKAMTSLKRSKVNCPFHLGVLQTDSRLRLRFRGSRSLFGLPARARTCSFPGDIDSGHCACSESRCGGGGMGGHRPGEDAPPPAVVPLDWRTGQPATPSLPPPTPAKHCDWDQLFSEVGFNASHTFPVTPFTAVTFFNRS